VAAITVATASRDISLAMHGKMARVEGQPLFGNCPSPEPVVFTGSPACRYRR